MKARPGLKARKRMRSASLVPKVPAELVLVVSPPAAPPVHEWRLNAAELKRPPSRLVRWVRSLGSPLLRFGLRG